MCVRYSFRGISDVKLIIRALDVNESKICGESNNKSHHLRHYLAKNEELFYEPFGSALILATC